MPTGGGLRGGVMAVLVVVFLVALVALSVVPGWWVGQVMRRHGGERADLGGTGADIARGLLDRAGLADVKVEETKEGDHYDSDTRTVRLSPPHFRGRSVTAVTVAAHEVGHALQHRDRDPAFLRRHAAVNAAASIQRIGAVVMMAAPVVGILFKNPLVAAVQIGCGLLLIGSQVIAHLRTLPVEMDASFERALPLLRTERILPESDMPAARRVLKAAAFTYVASALMTLIDIGRWLRTIRT
jgi:hypothetical protein